MKLAVMICDQCRCWKLVGLNFSIFLQYPGAEVVGPICRYLYELKSYPVVVAYLAFYLANDWIGSNHSD